MADNRSPKQVLEWMTPGRRRVTWMKEIHDKISEKRLEEGQLMHG
jgi:hypothetical protein